MAERDDRNWAALGEAIRARRRELGIHTQTAAAQRAGIDLNTWNKAERGRSVGGRGLQAIAKLLEWDPGMPHAILTRAEAPEAAVPGVGDARTPALAVIPMSTSMAVSGAILRALAVAWERENGQALVAADMCTESTPWGPAIVVRDPHATEETGDA
ncbi:helix-turn-helix domain-containing protein [Microbispora bryophytorum]|uniref:helix-turn-helix domain-containing protein n=1 Tax=Microbispora bryophytorum TaxID=1460882 RepID=UPI003405F904